MLPPKGIKDLREYLKSDAGNDPKQRGQQFIIFAQKHRKQNKPQISPYRLEVMPASDLLKMDVRPKWAIIKAKEQLKQVRLQQKQAAKNDQAQSDWQHVCNYLSERGEGDSLTAIRKGTKIGKRLTKIMLDEWVTEERLEACEVPKSAGARKGQMVQGYKLPEAEENQEPEPSGNGDEKDQNVKEKDGGTKKEGAE